MDGQYNKRSPAVKRLMREAQELKDPTSDYFAQPLSDNLFEWHFTVRGPADTEFDGGVYHGRIILPTEYPMKPPNIIVLTPNGRFETGQKICLSISGHHPESWQPSWSIRTALLAIIGFMPTPAQGTIGSLEYPKDERKKLAKRSLTFKCEECCEGKPVADLLLQPSSDKVDIGKEAEEIAKLMAFKGENTKSDSKPKDAPGDKKEALTPEEEQIRIRKEACKKMQERFRQKLLARTQGVVAQVSKSVHQGQQQASRTRSQASPASRGDGDQPQDPVRRQDTPRHANARQRAATSRVFFIEILIALIVVVIAAVLYRRSEMIAAYLPSSSTDGNAGK